jgi:hypothetical protein
MSASLFPGWQVCEWVPPAHADDGVGIVKRYVGSPYPTRAQAEAKLKAVSMFGIFPAFKFHFTVVEVNVEQRVYESWQRKGLVAKPEPLLPPVEPLEQAPVAEEDLKL